MIHKDEKSQLPIQIPALGTQTHISVFCLYLCLSHRLLYLRCGRKPGQDQSALCAACCLLTSLCDTIGAILAKQLTIQVCCAHRCQRQARHIFSSEPVPLLVFLLLQYPHGSMLTSFHIFAQKSPSWEFPLWLSSDERD